MKKVIGVIPARYGSTRFPGKPLTLILGKPMIAWVIEAAKRSKTLSEIIVATDDQRIAQVAKDLGIRSVMTDSALPTGTDRIYQAVKDHKVDIVVNIQGDEPLLDPEMIDLLVQPLLKDSALEMSTLAHEVCDEDFNNMNSVKVIRNQNNHAIYFSRFAIPFSRLPVETTVVCVLKHIGLYAYRAKFLEKFCEHGPCVIEEAESLEQLRALYMGAKIYVDKVNYRSIGVDSPTDVANVEKILKSRGHT